MRKLPHHNGLIKWTILLIVLGVGEAQAGDDFPAECLYDSVTVDIHDNYTAEITYSQKFKFLQPQASEYSMIKIPVNSYIDFELIDVRTKLPDGREIALKPRDIETISDFTPQYYPDSKSKILYVPAARANAEAEIKYKLTYKSLLYLPRFFRQKDIPTNNSYLVVNSSIPYSYYASEGLHRPSGPDSSRIFYADSIPPYFVEPHMPPPSDYQIVIKPDSVRYGGKMYGFASWSDVANFYNQLSEAGNELEPNRRIREIADSLVADAAGRDDSLKALLDYMIENIRYVSVDIGRGEFKPLPPAEVLEKKYGDCKDQSELLCSLCRAVGFRANPALMATRDIPGVVLALPWPGYFNHVITAVDTSGGYFFLDASQTTCCFGNLPFNLRNRRALVCGDSPFLEFTLTSPYVKANQIKINSSYIINNSNSMRVNITIEIARDPAFIFYSRDESQVLSNVLHAFFGDDLKGRYSSSFRLTNNAPDFIEVTGSLLEKPQSSPGSKRLLINMISPYLKILKRYFQATDRADPYAFDFTFNIDEENSFYLPGDYIVDSDSLSMAFNERGLKAEIYLNNNSQTVELSKSFNLFDYTIDAERYNKFAEFLLMVSQAPYNSIEILSPQE